uniref:Uncharacterized protein n=1 Tax=Hemiselmis andersenii TaxID=464988 RepID=A0A7S1E717_HEMAN
MLQDGGFFQGCMGCSNNTWKAGRGYNAENEFFSFAQRVHEPVVERVKHVRVPKGSLVMWDWRIPHRNAEQHFGSIPRSVIYTGYLPDVQINRDYAKDQLANFEAFEPPPDFADFHTLTEEASSSFRMSRLGRRLMAMDECR